MNILNIAILTTTTLLLASCGGTPAPGDTSPPGIVSLSPANGATGVTKDSLIVIQFSEKMNQAATQAAYQSTDLPAANVTFSWNAAGTTLTIHPNAELAYTPAGKTYAITLTSTATDQAGNALPATDSSFRTYRLLSATLTSIPELDGWVRSDGTVGQGGDDLLVGDSGAVDNATYRSYLSFDLGSLPAALPAERLVGATLTAYQRLVTGAPYTDLDIGNSDLIVDHVNYGLTLSATDFDPTVYGVLGDLSSSAGVGDKMRSVLGALKADLSAARTHSQYRLRFAALTDGDGVGDLSYLYAGNSATHKPTLEITYLMP